MGDKKDFFFKLRNTVLDDWARELGPGAFTVYCLFARLYNEKRETTVYMSHRGVAQQLGIHRNSVRAHLKKLSQLGLLRKVPCPGPQKGRHQHYGYVPTLPPPRPKGGTTIVLPVAQNGGTMANAEVTINQQNPNTTIHTGKDALEDAPDGAFEEAERRQRAWDQNEV